MAAVEAVMAEAAGVEAMEVAAADTQEAASVGAAAAEEVEEAVAEIAVEAMAATPASVDGAVTTMAHRTWISGHLTTAPRRWITATGGIAMEPSRNANRRG
jgi:hypothetical protein